MAAALLLGLAAAILVFVAVYRTDNSRTQPAVDYRAHRRRRYTLVAAISTSLLLATSAPAYAFESVTIAGYTNAPVVDGTSEHCSYINFTIDNHYGRPNAGTFGSLDLNSGTACAGPGAYVPANFLAIKQNIYRHNNGAWIICDSGPWVYNGQDADNVRTGFAWTVAPPCGAGDYKMIAYSYHIGVNGNWVGGGLMNSQWVYVS